MDTTLEPAGADAQRRWGGSCCRRHSSRLRGGRRCPSIRGTEKPQMSASMTPTVNPSAASARGQVDRDRGLADATLARGDHDDLGGRWDGGLLGALGDVAPGPLHGGGLLVLVQLGPVDADLGHAGERRRPGPGRPSGSGHRSGQPAGGEGDAHVHDAVGVDACPLGHAQLDDVGAELGVDHAAEQAHHVLLDGGGERGRRAGAGSVASSGRGRRSRRDFTGCRRVISVRGYHGRRVASGATASTC